MPCQLLECALAVGFIWASLMLGQPLSAAGTNNVLAGSERLLNREELTKLAAVAWESPPATCDVTWRKEFTVSTASLGKDTNAATRTYVPLTLGSPNTDSGRPEILPSVQSSPTTGPGKAERVLFQRIRWQEPMFRIDQSIVSNAAGADLTAPSSFDSTYVNTGTQDAGGRLCFRYDHKGRSAFIMNGLWKSDLIDEVNGLPQMVRMGLRVWMGKKTEGENARFVSVPDPAKMEEVLAGGRRPYNAYISDAPGSSGGRVRITFRSADDPMRTLLVMDCDARDYSRVFRLAMYDPQSGTLTKVRESGRFGKESFPESVHATEYGADGKIRKEEVTTVIRVALDAPIPPDVFVFQPPAGYQVTDLRKSLSPGTATKQ